MALSPTRKYTYDVAISFAGEDRAVALQLFDLLIARGISVFYDFNEQANLWGKDLIDHLTDVYANQARYCLMLISKYYPDKPWTQIERRSAQARAFRQPDEYILPIRIDDTEIPGLPSTISYLDLRRASIEEIADQVVKKLTGVVSQRPKVPETAAVSEMGKYKVPLPQMAISYTQLDKDRFIESAYEVMKANFRQALSTLEHRYPEVETNLKEIDAIKFVARIYVQGRLQNACKIWLGSTFGPSSIQYVEGSQIDFDHDNSMNDYLSVEQTKAGLGLKVSGFALGLGGIRPDQEVVSPEQGAEYLWKRFTSSLGCQ